MLTADDIAAAKKNISYSHPSEALHEHDDCIRLAYEWFDAQKTRETPSKKSHPLKHIIEKWAGRYVSRSDVEVAAYLHPGISGTYPDFNLSARLVFPSDRRLKNIGEALSQGYRDRLDPKVYHSRED